MSLDLSTYPSIATALFVKITSGYTALGDLTFSSYYRPLTIDGTSYTGLGSLMSVGDTTSELRLSSSEINVGISGINTTNMSDVLTYNLKGADILIYRGIFDAVTNTLLSITGNPAIRFKGIINNFGLSEDFEPGGKNSTVTINFACTSEIGMIERRVTGRRTNPDDQKKFYPTDVSMDRVPTLIDANFNFGAPLRLAA
jgi:hypothetical protein